jgi:hypothetical protein
LRFGGGIAGGGNDEQLAALPVEFVERKSLTPLSCRDHPKKEHFAENVPTGFALGFG